jgi:hypothetical protein
MRTYRVMEVYLHRWKWVGTALRHDRFNPGKSSQGSNWIGESLDAVEKRKISCPYRESNPSSSVLQDEIYPLHWLSYCSSINEVDMLFNNAVWTAVFNLASNDIRGNIRCDSVLALIRTGHLALPLEWTCSWVTPASCSECPGFEPGRRPSTLTEVCSLFLSVPPGNFWDSSSARHLSTKLHDLTS